jgi:hypothetical protein
MGPETIFYADQCHRLVISAEYSARSPFEGCSFLSQRRLRRGGGCGSTLHHGLSTTRTAADLR